MCEASSVSTSVANSPDVRRKRQGKTVDAPDGTNPHKQTNNRGGGGRAQDEATTAERLSRSPGFHGRALGSPPGISERMTDGHVAETRDEETTPASHAKQKLVDDERAARVQMAYI